VPLHRDPSGDDTPRQPGVWTRRRRPTLLHWERNRSPGDPIVAEHSCPSPDDLTRFVLGTLPEATLEAVAAHLDRCPACEAAVKALEDVSDPVLAAIRNPHSGPASTASHSPSAPPPPLPEQLGDFRIVREIGRGGMGVVYEAEQISLGRHVALKVLPRHALLDPESVERFRREAKAAAGLHHTNIVPVFGTGEHDGLHYFVMQLIPGVGLDVLIRDLEKQRGKPTAVTPRAAAAPSAEERTEKVPSGSGGSGTERALRVPHPALAASSGSGRAYWLAVARIGVQVAEALAFAHAHGVLHRDIKPSNLLLDAQGTVWVTDFGLAKAAADGADLTHSGDIIGTLRYMAPERFRGKSDPRSDLYSLGITLYELLTFRSPFAATDRNQLLHQVVHEEPPRPRRVNREVPRDLETIVLKATAKDPAHRYATAQELADDLRRFLDDRPVRARQVTPPERLWRWCRRDPRTAALLGALLLALTAGLVGVATQWQRAEGKARDEYEARQEAQRNERAAHDALYQSRIAQAQLEWRLNDVAGAEQLLEACDHERRGWEWHYLHNVNRGALDSLRTADLPDISNVAFSPDGRLLAFAGWNPYADPKTFTTPPVVVADLATGQAVHTLPVPPRWGVRATFAAAGRRLVVSSPDGLAQLWDAASGRRVSAWDGGGLAALSPDGRLLATGGRDAVVLRAVPSGNIVRRFPSPGGRVTWRPDGRVLAVSGPKAVELRDAITGKEVGRLPYLSGTRADSFFPEEGPEVAFSPDGQWLVVATGPPEVWDVAAGRRLHTLAGHDGGVPGVAFSPDGRRIATAGDDGTVRLWDARSGSEVAVLRGHVRRAACVAFHPDGWLLASGSREPGDVKLWDLTRDAERLTLPLASAQALAFAGGRLELLDARGRLQSRDPVSGQVQEGGRVDLVDLRTKWATPANIAAFADDGRLLAAVAADGRTVKVWQVDDAKKHADLTGLAARAVHVALSADGRRAAAAAFPLDPNDAQVREVRVWGAATGQALAVFHPQPGPRRFLHGAVALSPDGTRVAFDDYDAVNALDAVPARVRICDAASGEELLHLPAGEAAIWSLTFSPDGRLLAAGGFDGKVRVWDTATGKPLYRDDLEGPFYRLAFSPDGQRLAGVDREQVKVWHVPAGKEVLTLRGAGPRPSDNGFNPALAWSPDGRWLAATTWEGGVAVWDAAESEVPVREPPLGRVPAARIDAWHLAQAEAALAAWEPAAAAFHLKRLRAAEPPDLLARRRRAQLLLRARDWKGAAADDAALFAAGDPDEPGAWLEYARALLLTGDRAGYRRLCDRLRAAFPRVGGIDLVLVARAYGLGDGFASDAGATARALAGDPTPDARLARGVALYRAGQWDQARACLREFVKASPTSAWLAWPVQALAEHRLGHAAEARALFKKAAAWQRQQTAKAEASAGFSPEPEWADFLIYDAEADALLHGGQP
jgi:serine/threonine protein kinase/WD40 repeat protein